MELAAPGVTLHLSGRDAARLEAAAQACRARGAAVQARVLDVRDAAAMAAWIAGAGRLDLVVANAGISAGTGGGRPESAAQTRAVFAANLDGMLNTVLPALAVMQAQAPGPDGVRGRIAVVASIAAFVPAPGAPAYCASKAAAGCLDGGGGADGAAGRDADDQPLPGLCAHGDDGAQPLSRCPG